MDGLSYETISIIGNCVTTVIRQLNFPNFSERAKAFRSRSACCQRLLAYEEMLAAFGCESVGSPAPACTLNTSRSRARGSKLWGYSARRALTAEFFTDVNPLCSRTILRAVANPKPLSARRVARKRFEVALECHLVNGAPVLLTAMRT